MACSLPTIFIYLNSQHSLKSNHSQPKTEISFNNLSTATQIRDRELP